MFFVNRKFEKIPLLNNYIENSILNYYDSFYTMAKKDWEEMNHQRKDLNSSSSDLPPFDYIINFEVLENDKYISVLIDSYNFCGGALEKAMATHSSVLAWRIPGTGEPGWLPSMWLHRVRHD